MSLSLKEASLHLGRHHNTLTVIKSQKKPKYYYMMKIGNGCLYTGYKKYGVEASEIKSKFEELFFQKQEDGTLWDGIREIVKHGIYKSKESAWASFNSIMGTVPMTDSSSFHFGAFLRLKRIVEVWEND